MRDARPLADLVAQRGAHLGVQCAERLVEQQDFGVGRERDGDFELALRPREARAVVPSESGATGRGEPGATTPGHCQVVISASRGLMQGDRQALVDQVYAWEAYGTIEPEAGEALRGVARNPALCNLKGKIFVMFGNNDISNSPLLGS